MSMYTTAQLLAANEQKFKFDPLFLRLFFRESYPFTTEKVYLSQIPGLVNMALYVSPIVSGEVIRSRGGSTSEFTPGYVKPKHEVNPQMTLRRLPDEDPQNLADPAYRRRRIIMQNMRDEELAIAQVEEMQAVSAVLKGKYTMTGEAFDPVPQRRHPRRTRKRRKPAQNPQKRLPHRPPVRRRHRHHLRLLQKMRRPDRRQQQRAAPRRHPRRRQRQLAVRRRQLRAKVRRNPRQRAPRQRQNGQRILHPPWRLRMRARRKRG